MGITIMIAGLAGVALCEFAVVYGCVGGVCMEDEEGKGVGYCNPEFRDLRASCRVDRCNAPLAS